MSFFKYIRKVYYEDLNILIDSPEEDYNIDNKYSLENYQIFSKGEYTFQMNPKNVTFKKCNKVVLNQFNTIL